MSNTLKNIFEISYIILLYCYTAMLVACLSLRLWVVNFLTDFVS